jgi:hypothetical protein
MSRTSTLIALVLGSIALAGAASAQTRFQAQFTYDNALSTEQNYAVFQETARRACAVTPMEVGGMTNKMRYEAQCKARLLRDAVRASGHADLVALHDLQTSAPATIVADRR